MTDLPDYTDLTSLDGTEEFVLDDSGTTKNVTADVIASDQYLSKSVAGAADVALTAAEAYNKRIKLTGAITDNINVTIPDNTERLYTIENATTGSYTVTFKTVSGTGIVVGKGGQVLLSSDGTNINEIYAVPKGLISLWSGAISAIPSGWAICDGNNGTPDLTDRFVIHADADSGGTRDVGMNGGSHTMTDHTHSYSLTADSHNHSFLNYVDNTTQGTFSRGTDGGGGAYGYQSTTSSPSLGVSGTVGTGSAATSTSIMPKYYALAYIMKL